MRLVTIRENTIYGKLSIPMRDYEAASRTAVWVEDGVIHPHEGL